jgi:hypothetical protein
MLPAKIGSIWPRCFRGEDFFNISLSEKRINLGALQQLGQMEPNLAVSIYVRSSIKFLHFVPFHQQIWPPRAILVSDWLLFKKIFSSETAWQNGAKLGRKHLCKILCKASSFGSATILKGTHPGTIYARFGHLT